VQRLLGDGATGRVLGCLDSSSQAFVAVKVAKDSRHQMKQALAEVEVLRKLQSFDEALCRHHCADFLDTFLHAERHACLVFEPLAVNLSTIIRDAGRRGLLLRDIREITSQLLGCLSFMHAAGVVHTDLKCTNLMLRDSGYDQVPHPRCSGAWAPKLHKPHKVVLIDFGCAMDPDKQGHGRVGARHIRAPEVVLGLRWAASADLWSLGCTLATLYTGERLFPVHADMEHLAAMERIADAHIPSWMALQVADRIKAKGVAFDNSGRLEWPGHAASRRAVEKVDQMLTLREQVLPRHGNFLALLQGLLEIQPKARLTAEAAMRTAFVTAEQLFE